MRHVKQLLYGIFYLALWSGLIAGAYAWQKPTASCFDGTKNQDEAGVDCGGTCYKACIPDALAALEAVGSAKFIPLKVSSSVSRASLVAEIRNRNGNFGASGFSYEFQVFDQGGALVASFPDRSFIYAGEVKQLVLPNVAVPVAGASARIEFGDPQWTPASRFPRPQLVVQTANTVLANDNLTTRGTLANQDSIGFPKVELAALYYDLSGTVVGVSATELEHVDPGTSRDFALFHPPLPNAALDRTQVFVTAFNPR